MANLNMMSSLFDIRESFASCHVKSSFKVVPNTIWGRKQLKPVESPSSGRPQIKSLRETGSSGQMTRGKQDGDKKAPQIR